MIAAVVLAAGSSRRMGQAKLLLPLEGRALVRHAVERALGGGVDRTWMVVGPDSEALQSALAGLDVEFVVNPAPQEGQASSIRAGIAVLPPAVEAALVMLGDQPMLSPTVIPALLAAARRSGRPLVAPRYRDGQGNPVLFRRELFGELLELAGDQGARPVVQRVEGRVEWVHLDLPMPTDVDTPEDYEKIRERLRAGNHAV